MKSIQLRNSIVLLLPLQLDSRPISTNNFQSITFCVPNVGQTGTKMIPSSSFKITTANKSGKYFLQIYRSMKI